jgi:proteasome lid subunit RPN8/RPN11
MTLRSRIKIRDAAPPTFVDEPMPLDRSLKWVSKYDAQIDPQVTVFFAQSAYLKCIEHAESDLEHEVGGVLVGEVRVDPACPRPYLLVEDALRAAYTDSSEVHVTFTRDTLVHLNRELEERFPGKRIVGWYHTHPNLSVFLSNHDTWLHRNFFGDPTQVALVLDPGSRTAGFFCWQVDGSFDPVRHVGFFEYSDLDDESVVDLENLAPVIQDKPTPCGEATLEKGEAT